MSTKEAVSGHQNEIAESSWRSIAIFHDGDRFFDALTQAIQSAQISIRLESYIFATDRLGMRILDLLGAAVRLGVEVQLIVDAVGSAAWSVQLREAANARQIPLKVFHELPWTRLWRSDGKKRRFRMRRAFQRLNSRNHRKLCIVDGASAFIGSMNIIEYHLSAYAGTCAWRDTGVCVQGQEVEILAESFDELWSKRPVSLRFARKRHHAASSGNLVKLNVRRAQRRENYLDILLRIVGARQRIWIENAYFVPDGSLVRALAVAAQSGVDVRIVVPAESDVVFIPWVTAAFHDGLLRAGVRIFEYTKSMLHAKTILVDDWGLVGSSNLNHRSLLHDLEADVVLADEAACNSLKEQFEIDCSHAREVTLSSWRQRAWIERLFGRLLLTLRRFL